MAARAYRASHAAAMQGFTLLELLLVVSIMAIAAGGVAWSLRDPAEQDLAREAERLAAMLESGRAQSRLQGLPLHWVAQAGGFRFDGLVVPAGATPSIPVNARWLNADTTTLEPVGGNSVLLGPEAVLPAQSILLAWRDRPALRMRVHSDGIRPFSVQRESP